MPLNYSLLCYLALISLFLLAFQCSILSIPIVLSLPCLLCYKCAHHSTCVCAVCIYINISGIWRNDNIVEFIYVQYFCCWSVGCFCRCWCCCSFISFRFVSFAFLRLSSLSLYLSVSLLAWLWTLVAAQLEKTTFTFYAISLRIVCVLSMELANATFFFGEMLL